MKQLHLLLFGHLLNRRLMAELVDLVTPFSHAPEIRRHRAELTKERVQMVAKLFAVLTPAWIVVDIVAFNQPVWLDLAILRLVATAGFLTIAFWRPPEVQHWRATLVPLLALMSIPPLFYLLSNHVLMAAELGTSGQVIARTYDLVPLLVIAGLGVFPLTALEVMLVAVPVIALTLLIPSPLASSWESRAESLWLMVLLVGVSITSSSGQLRHMMVLVARAIEDPLTGARTRRSGEETLKRQFAQADRNQGQLAVAFIDIDDFKSINDSYGHDVGDQMLRQAATTLRSLLRPTDLLVRWGGEEFLLLLPGVDGVSVHTVMERIVDNGLGVRPDGKPLTASIGVADLKSDPAVSSAALVELADSRMYAAKQGGKNRYVAASAAA